MSGSETPMLALPDLARRCKEAADARASRDRVAVQLDSEKFARPYEHAAAIGIMEHSVGHRLARGIARRIAWM